jgi:hypothetical protein
MIEPTAAIMIVMCRIISLPFDYAPPQHRVAAASQHWSLPVSGRFSACAKAQIHLDARQLGAILRDLQ